MKYEKPVFEILILETDSIFTLNQSNGSDPVISNPNEDDPWA